MPRPVRMSPVPSGLGDGRASQPYVSAAALSTAIDRARRNPVSSSVPAVSSFMRNSSGSAFAATASFVDERLGREGRPADRWGRAGCRCAAASPTRSGRPTTSPSSGDSESRTCPTASRRCRGRAGLAASAHQLRDQHGVGLVVAEVVVVAGARVVVVAPSDLPCASRAAAHLHQERRALGVPRRLLVAHPLHAHRPAELAGRSRPPRSRRRRPRCGRSPAGPASRRRAPARAACRGTSRRRSACRTTSCRSSRSSSDRSTGSAMACAPANAVCPWNGTSYSASMIFAALAKCRVGISRDDRACRGRRRRCRCACS